MTGSSTPQRERRDSKEPSDFPRIISATRLHLPSEATELPAATKQHLQNYVRASERLGIVAAIAVNSHEEEVRSVAREAAPNYTAFHVLHVPYWGAFIPALNALLNFAQRQSMRYILYQSLETHCAPAVLQRLLDHHNADTLVVGPVLNGHNFKPGEQQLNGRTTPWNTLALWSVRKLALTGFLCIADGLPDVPPSSDAHDLLSQQDASLEAKVVNPQDGEDDDDINSTPMGSNDWWSRSVSSGMGRETTEPGSVPAGVEEVTAVALLQHLHGRDRARALLVQLPADLEEQMLWDASWAGDKRREAWHKYKMESKVTRPAAQLHELFSLKRRNSIPQTSPTGSATTGSPPITDTAEPAVGQINYGTVMHYGESIPPPAGIKWICLFTCGLFYFNSTAILSSVFHRLNTAAPSASELGFVSLLIGGVFVPMPIALWLTRFVVSRYSHIAGLLLFGAFMTVGHILVILVQSLYPSHGSHALFCSRLVQGFGSGVLFQIRFILGSLSTSDFHKDLQAWQFLANDMGLGLGALLPVATTVFSGATFFNLGTDEIWPSAVLALISVVYIACVLYIVPGRLPMLPYNVRCGRNGDHRSPASKLDPKSPRLLWLSGTTRVFIQSAILPALALSMRDAQWVGNFRQTFAVAALCLLPMPFEVLVSRMCCACQTRRPPSEDSKEFSKLLSGGVGAVALVIACIKPLGLGEIDGVSRTLIMRTCELAILMVALGMAAPLNATRLYLQKDAENAIVVLEWMKAYIGRLLGPLFAVLCYTWAGYGPLLACLSIATAVVTLTA